jgi:hypothetical protein
LPFNSDPIFGGAPLPHHQKLGVLFYCKSLSFWEKGLIAAAVLNSGKETGRYSSRHFV